MGWKAMSGNYTGDWPRTPPSGGSGVTKEMYGVYPEQGVAAANTFYKEVVATIIPNGIHIGMRPVQHFVPISQELKLEPGWKDEIADLTEQVFSLKEWVRELMTEIEALKRDKVDRYNQGVTLL